MPEEPVSLRKLSYWVKQEHLSEDAQKLDPTLFLLLMKSRLKPTL